MSYSTILISTLLALASAPISLAVPLPGGCCSTPQKQQPQLPSSSPSNPAAQGTSLSPEEKDHLAKESNYRLETGRSGAAKNAAVPTVMNWLHYETLGNMDKDHILKGESGGFRGRTPQEMGKNLETVEDPLTTRYGGVKPGRPSVSSDGGYTEPRDSIDHGPSISHRGSMDVHSARPSVDLRGGRPSVDLHAGRASVGLTNRVGPSASALGHSRSSAEYAGIYRGGGRRDSQDLRGSYDPRSHTPPEGNSPASSRSSSLDSVPLGVRGGPIQTAMPPPVHVPAAAGASKHSSGGGQNGDSRSGRSGRADSRTPSSGKASSGSSERRAMRKSVRRPI